MVISERKPTVGTATNLFYIPQTKRFLKKKNFSEER